MALTQIKSTLLAPQAVGWVKISSATPAINQVGWEITSGLDDTYDLYMIVATHLSIDTDATAIKFYWGAGSYLSSNYGYDVVSTVVGAAASKVTSASDDHVKIFDSITGNATGETHSFVIQFNNPNHTDEMHKFWWQGCGINTAAKLVATRGMAFNTSQAAITKMKFDSGTSGRNFDASGKVALYGLSK